MSTQTHPDVTYPYTNPDGSTQLGQNMRQIHDPLLADEVSQAWATFAGPPAAALVAPRSLQEVLEALASLSD